MRVQRAGREREDPAEERVLRRPGEQQIDDAGGVGQRPAERDGVDHDAPEEHRSAEEVRVLEDVQSRVLDSRVVQRRPVPEIDAADEQQDRDEWMAQDVTENAHRSVPRERSHDAGTHDIGQSKEHRPHRLADEQERRRDRGEEHVLQHVDAEEVRGQHVERGHQREEKRRDPEEEDSGPPHRPPPPLHPAHAARVSRRREDGDDDR